MAKNKLETVKDLANKLLDLMGSKAKAGVTYEAENEAYLVEIKTEEEMGLLIGRHGETLKAIETALSMILKQKTGEWIRVIVNIGDWRKKQEEYLGELATQAAERAKETKEPQPIYNLTPAQRRIIHMALSKNQEVTTESVGEGEERYLVVKPKN